MKSNQWKLLAIPFLCLSTFLLTQSEVVYANEAEKADSTFIEKSGAEDGKTEELEEKTEEKQETKLENYDEQKKDSIQNEEKLTKDKQKIETEIKKLKKEKSLLSYTLPEDIQVGLWYPREIVHFPTKRNYKHLEAIDLKGLVIRFVRVRDVGERYIEEFEDYDYSQLSQGIKGWQLHLKTTNEIYQEETNGKMMIKFSFKLMNESLSKE